MKVLLIVLGLAGSAWWALDYGQGSPAWGGSDAQTSYYGNGQPRSELSYRDGQPHGPAREWFPDGTEAACGEYLNGLRHGEWTFWHVDGSLNVERSGQYVDGQRVAPAQDSADS